MAASLVTVLVNSAIIIGISIGIILGTYLFLKALDRWCSVSQDHFNFNNYDSGRIARAAGLPGMDLKERRSVLAKILVSKPFSIEMKISIDAQEKSEYIADEKTLKKNESSEETETETKFESDTYDEESGKLNCEEETKKTCSCGDSVSTNAGNDTENMDTSNTCVICLDGYEEGQLVITGKHCPHMFHGQCIMEWLEKHDVCPFCREDMFTADEFKQAAVQTLHEDRIQQLTFMNSREREFNQTALVDDNDPRAATVQTS